MVTTTAVTNASDLSSCLNQKCMNKKC